MISKIAKMLMPSPERLAKMAASKVQEIANSSDVLTVAAKYSAMADETMDVCRFITDIVRDGKIDDAERDRIAERLTPLFARLAEMI